TGRDGRRRRREDRRQATRGGQGRGGQGAGVRGGQGCAQPAGDRRRRGRDPDALEAGPAMSSDNGERLTGTRDPEHGDEAGAPERGGRHDYAPEGADRDSGWWATIKRTATEFQEDNLSDWAAALTYYGLLSLFPALIAMVSLIGIFGDPKST